MRFMGLLLVTLSCSEAPDPPSPQGAAQGCTARAAALAECDAGWTSPDGAAQSCTAAECDAGPSASPAEPVVLVTPSWLESRMGDLDIQLIDARADFDGGHVPGAIPLRPTALVDPQASVRSQVMQAPEAEDVLGSIGIRNDATLVVYGGPDRKTSFPRGTSRRRPTSIGRAPSPTGGFCRRTSSRRSMVISTVRRRPSPTASPGGAPLSIG